jgi:hypothetical protein
VALPPLAKAGLSFFNAATVVLSLMPTVSVRVMGEEKEKMKLRRRRRRKRKRRRRTERKRKTMKRRRFEQSARSIADRGNDQ